MPTELPEVTHGSASAVTLRPSDLRISTDEAGILAYMGDLSSEGGWHALARLSEMSSGLQFFPFLPELGWCHTAKASRQGLGRPFNAAEWPSTVVASTGGTGPAVAGDWAASKGGRFNDGHAANILQSRIFCFEFEQNLPVSAIAIHIPTPRVNRTAICLSGLPSAVIHWCARGVGLLPASG